MGIRLFTFLHASGKASREIQYQGPPEELSGGKDLRTALPQAQILIIEEEDEGTYLYRFTADGRFGGDTWHAGIHDAKHQAHFEYGDAIGEWHSIPPAVNDSLAYARSRMT